MADDKRVARTAGVYGTFHVGDLAIDPEGAEVTFDEWLTLAAAATENRVVVRLDEDFPAELYAAAAEKRLAESDEGSAPKTVTPETTVDGANTDTSTTAPGRRARNGG